MPDDDTIRLTLPPDADLAPVASIAVRAAARQVALSEDEIGRLRAAVVAAIEDRIAHRPTGDIELALHPGPGRLDATVDGDPVA